MGRFCAFCSVGRLCKGARSGGCGEVAAFLRYIDEIRCQSMMEEALRSFILWFLWRDVRQI